jgi:long-subunit acyl-CoA synthetase (AMP-forming)
MVVVGLPNSPAHFFATFAAWKLGALTLPLRSVMAAKERDSILALGKPQVVVANWPDLPYTTLSADALATPLTSRMTHCPISSPIQANPLAQVAQPDARKSSLTRLPGPASPAKRC